MSISTLEFEQLFKTSHKDLCQVAFRIVNDRDTAKDIVQDVFLKLWKLRDSVKAEPHLHAYLHKATANASLNALESNKRFLSYNQEAKQTVSSSHDNISNTISLKELESQIQKALLQLPPKCRAIFVLSRYEGLRYKQIAEYFDISVKTVENQMGKALQIMREELKPFLTREFLLTTVSVGITMLLHFLSIIFIVIMAGIFF